jgi:predicted N-acyltransferase
MEKILIVDTLKDVDELEWNSITGSNPFLQFYFLTALRETGCAASNTGWTQQFILYYKNDTLVGAAPMYLKTHSRGEFVFDFAWAEAYKNHGLQYYPKAVIAVPFTPVTGPRLIGSSINDKLTIAKAAINYTAKMGISSIHVLFPDPADLTTLKAAGFSIREGIQFHWRNKEYQNFNEFLNCMKHDKRKKIRQSRNLISKSNVTFKWLLGSDITNEYLDFFYYCYSKTYFEHRSRPYLSIEFFKRIINKSPESFLLIVAKNDNESIASALNVVGDGVLYGRYWGCSKFISGLHFETCYLQAIEYCIQNKIALFEGGAQGEHKIARGLLPTKTYSAHWISDSRFSGAIDNFLDDEINSMQQHFKELEESTPFKKSLI